MTTKDSMIHAVTEYDRQQSKRQGYNPHALAIYFQRIDEVCSDIERGADMRAAILAGFDGTLRDRILKSVSLPTTKERDDFGTKWYYDPVTRK